jgi:hypothetical protein
MLSGLFVSLRNHSRCPDDHAAYVGCGVGLNKCPEENQEPISPLCSRLAAVQVWNSLDFDALRAKVIRRYIVARERRWVASHE